MFPGHFQALCAGLGCARLGWVGRTCYGIGLLGAGSVFGGGSFKPLM